jgi:hypothetical protein
MGFLEHRFILEHGLNGLGTDLFACGDGVLIEHGLNGLDTDLFACGDWILIEHGLGTDFSIFYHPKGCGARGNSAKG